MSNLYTSKYRTRVVWRGSLKGERGGKEACGSGEKKSPSVQRGLPASTPIADRLLESLLREANQKALDKSRRPFRSSLPFAFSPSLRSPPCLAALYESVLAPQTR